VSIVLVSRVSANTKNNPVYVYTIRYQGAKLVQVLQQLKFFEHSIKRCSFLTNFKKTHIDNDNKSVFFSTARVNNQPNFKKKLHHGDYGISEITFTLLEVLKYLSSTIYTDRKSEKNGHFHRKIGTKSHFPIDLKPAINLRFE
jgi:hypothetical protein